jgi:hypothetical protein
MPLAVYQPDNGDRLAWRHIVARREIRLLRIVKYLAELLRRNDDGVTTAHIQQIQFGACLIAP